MTDKMREILAEQFAKAGAKPIELPVLYHADLFVDLIGEDIRRRLYVAPGANGEMMAMRPELTIPAALHHLENAQPGQPAVYGCVGPVFRQRADGQPGEFHQAGIEHFGIEGGAAFDAGNVAQAVETVMALSGKSPVVTIGDRALFSVLLTSLETSSVWQRRLEGAFGDRAVLDRMLARLGNDSADSHGAVAGLARVLDGKASEDVREAVEEMLAIAGLAAVGGRSVGDIAERYMEKAELAAKAGWEADKLDILSRYLAISGPAGDALDRLRAFDAQEGGPLGDALVHFAERFGVLREQLPESVPLVFKADFGRRLDYYSGFNFELHFEGASQPVAGGGRYDRLPGLLMPKVSDQSGDTDAVPAVGFAIWLDRLADASEQGDPS